MPLIALLTSTFATEVSCHPLVSVNVKRYVWVRPLLRGGIIPPTPGPVTINPGMFKVPKACHPEFEDASLAAKYTTLLPAKPGANVMDTLKPRVVPLDETELASAVMLHWLFCTIPPGGTTMPEYGPPASPASSTR